jgi:hypothetical protein
VMLRGSMIQFGRFTLLGMLRGFRIGYGEAGIWCCCLAFVRIAPIE